MSSSQVRDFLRSFEMAEPPAADLQLGEVLLPETGSLSREVHIQFEQSITKVALKSAPYFPAPTPGMRFELVVGGRVQAELAFDYLHALWPEAYKLKVPVPCAQSDRLVISAAQPCTVVLGGCENLPIR